MANYATKDDVKNITHVDVSSFASKTNLAALKIEVDKIDVDKLKTTPTDLAELTNTVENDLVKKTDYNTKVTSIETQIAGLTKNTVDNLADITKLRAIDTNSFVLKTKLVSDVTTLESKIDTVDKKIPDISGLATKTSLTSYLQTATFNSKVTEVENKIKATGIKAKSGNSDYYSMKGIENIKKEMPILKNDERMYVYLQGSHFQQNNVLTLNNDHVINKNVINTYIVYKLDPIASIRDTTFTIQNALFGAMQITKNADTSNYHYKGYGICFDESEQFSHTITEGGRAHTTLAKNVIIFGADMSFSKHANNKANNIYVMGKDYVQKINDTTTYAEKKYYRNFTYLGKKFMLSLHYNGDDSYLFVNSRQELKFKTKTDQLVKEKLCVGNLSDQWTTGESEKTGVYGKNYDFVVDYEQILGITKIYDMHKYLITKHNISP